MDFVLEKLFGSLSRLRLLRLFLLNPTLSFSIETLLNRTKVESNELKRELNLLKKIGFVKINKRQHFEINSSFGLYSPLKNLVLTVMPISGEELLKKLKEIGKLRLVVISGIFLQKEDSRIDLLVVADAIRKKKQETILKELEVEIGKELKYSFISTDEFKYRFKMYDKFIRDILDSSHEKLYSKIDGI